MTANPDDSGIPAQRGDAAPSHLGRYAARRVVAVVSDGSALAADGSVAADSFAPLLHDDAAGLRARGGIPVRAVPLSAHDADDLAAQLRDLPADTGAIFLTHTDPARARAVQRTLRETGGPPVVTDADTTAISLAAALLTALAHGERAPMVSRIIIAGSAIMPDLSLLLMAVGIGDISSWNASDAHAFPLHHLARHADAVIDLIGATHHPSGWWPGDRGSTVISPDDPSYRLLPAPGLFAALLNHPDATLDFDVLRVCAHIMAAATPRDRRVPELENPHLAEAITSAVLLVLTQHASPHSPDLPRE